MACHKTALGPIFLYRLVAHLVLVQSLPADGAPSVRPDGVLLESESSDAQLDARARPRAILHSTMVHGESNVIQSDRRRHVCGLFFEAIDSRTSIKRDSVRHLRRGKTRQENASRTARVFDYDYSFFATASSASISLNSRLIRFCSRWLVNVLTSTMASILRKKPGTIS